MFDGILEKLHGDLSKYYFDSRLTTCLRYMEDISKAVRTSIDFLQFFNFRN